jgi:hypothetical protein
MTTPASTTTDRLRELQAHTAARVAAARTADRQARDRRRRQLREQPEFAALSANEQASILADADDLVMAERHRTGKSTDSKMDMFLAEEDAHRRELLAHEEALLNADLDIARSNLPQVSCPK